MNLFSQCYVCRSAVVHAVVRKPSKAACSSREIETDLLPYTIALILTSSHDDDDADADDADDDVGIANNY